MLSKKTTRSSVASGRHADGQPDAPVLDAGRAPSELLDRMATRCACDCWART